MNTSKWDVSNVINIYAMFLGTYSFHGDISKWNVRNVTGMGCMFSGANRAPLVQMLSIVIFQNGMLVV